MPHGKLCSNGLDSGRVIGCAQRLVQPGYGADAVTRAAHAWLFGCSNRLDAICENCDLLHKTCRETGGAIMSPKLTQLLEEITPQGSVSV